MHTKEETLTLTNLLDGAAVTAFGIEQEKVIQDIQDPYSDPIAPRSVTLKVTYKPNFDRDIGDIIVSVSPAKLPKRVLSTKVEFSKDLRGRGEIREFETGQPNMFTAAGNVVPISEGQENGQN
jgi:hypothetical protein